MSVVVVSSGIDQKPELRLRACRPTNGVVWASESIRIQTSPGATRRGLAPASRGTSCSPSFRQKPGFASRRLSVDAVSDWGRVLYTAFSNLYKFFILRLVICLAYENGIIFTFLSGGPFRVDRLLAGSGQTGLLRDLDFQCSKERPQGPRAVEHDAADRSEGP